jgi:phage FluMu gp28-like protein
MILTKPQTKIFDDQTRFRVVVAGRRFGKTFLSTAELLARALTANDQNVWYVAPTYKAAKEIAWEMLISHSKDE